MVMDAQNRVRLLIGELSIQNQMLQAQVEELQARIVELEKAEPVLQAQVEELQAKITELEKVEPDAIAPHKTNSKKTPDASRPDA